MNFRKLPRNTAIFLACWLCLAPNIWRRGNVQATSPADDAAQAEALLELSDRQNYENHALALQTAQQALGLWQALADRDGMARTYGQIGRCYYAQSDLPEAGQNYEMALQLWRDLNNSQKQAETLIMLGYIGSLKGEWSNSISLLTQAQGLIGETNDPLLRGQIAAGLADIFNASGLPENGLVQYQSALAYYHQTSDPRNTTMVLWALGSTYLLLGNNDEALRYLQQALAAVAPDSLDAALCSEYLGRVYIAMGEYPVALPYLQSALTIYTRAVNPKEAAQVQGLIGQIYQQQGKLERARQNYREALATFRNLSDCVNQAAIYFVLGQLELKSRHFDAAEANFRQSIDVTENIRRISTGGDLAAAFTATIYERYENYIECLMRRDRTALSQNTVVRAFETSELARGRSLAEWLRATETNLVPGLDPQLVEQERALRQQLRVKEDYRVALLSQAHQKSEFDALEAELARLEGAYKQVLETIRTRYPAYEQITRPVAWSLQQIQEQVIADDQTVLLEYSLGLDQSYVWAVTREGIKIFNLPARAVIEAAARKVYEQLAAPPDPVRAKDLDQAIEALSKMILSPVADELNKHRILVVADGVLHYIPFQVLPAPQAAGEPLVASYEIVNIPSASILGELREESTHRQPTKMLAAFGDPVFASSYAQRKDATGGEQSAATPALELARWQHALRDIELNQDGYDPSALKPLFYARRELANLRDVAAGRETFVASGFAATREQLLKMDLSQFAILHFATHGLLDPRHPENSGLVLSTVNRDGQSQNGFVGLQDIYGLHAPVDLVVLSACRTALGKDVRGEGLLGLTRGFMYAGASSVLASLWKVDDEATAELMRQTYINMLQKGMTPAEALRAAQNSIRQTTDWKSPYYWAGFTLQGEYRQIIQPASAGNTMSFSWKIMIVAGLMLLVGVALGIRRFRRRASRRVAA